MFIKKLKNVLNKISWDIAPYLWLFFKIIGKFSKKNNSIVFISKEIHILTSKDWKFNSQVVIGQDLTNSSINWLSDLHPNSLIKVIDEGKVKNNENAEIIFITYDWLLYFVRNNNLISAIIRSTILSFRLKNSYKFIYIAIPDTYYLPINIVSQLLLLNNNGIMLLMQNLVEEANKYGLIKTSNKYIWTWPKKRQHEWNKLINWDNKKNQIIIASTGGCNKRKHYASQLSKIFKSVGFDIIESNLKYNWNDYIHLINISKIIFTTCWLQDGFKVGPNYYRTNLSEYTITGRVWEGFYSGSLVITNNNPILNYYGFYPNTHFLDLEKLQMINLMNLSDVSMSTIAKNAQENFISLLNV